MIIRALQTYERSLKQLHVTKKMCRAELLDDVCSTSSDDTELTLHTHRPLSLPLAISSLSFQQLIVEPKPDYMLEDSSNGSSKNDHLTNGFVHDKMLGSEVKITNDVTVKQVSI